MKYRKSIYLKAAKAIASHREDFSCNAVRHVAERHAPGDATEYHDHYNHTFGMPWVSIQGEWQPPMLDIQSIKDACGETATVPAPPSRQRSFRVWLLCMMAACCNDMEDRND